MRFFAVAGACFGVLLGLFFSARAEAFDYEEHKYISNLGFKIAIAAAASRDLPTDPLLKLVSEQAIADGQSFGDIVGLVDYLPDVDALLERRGETDTALASFDALDWTQVSRETNDPLRFLQIAHGNESHFQSAALMAHLDRHDEAILMARDGRLFRAMVVEAYGLHFLEDFHAPGHVATTRGVLPDYVSIASHETFNSTGLDFVMHGDEEFKKLIAKAIDLDLRPLAQKDVPESLPLDAEDFRNLQAALESGARQRFRGDSLLARNRIQAAYLAILTARSVADVLDAYCPEGRAAPARRNKNSFVPLCWYFGFYPSGRSCGGERIPDQGGPLLRASTPFGGYSASDLHFLRFVFNPGDVFLFSYYNEFSVARGIAGHAGASEIVAESLLASLTPSRFVTNGEDAPKRFFSVQRWGWVAPSLLYGVSHTFGDNNSNGFHARLLLAVPRIDVQASISYGVRYYDLGYRSLTTFPLGYGLEAGFGFFLLHLGVNEELSKDPVTRQLKAHRLVRGGLTLVVPKSVYRVPFQKLGRALRRKRKEEPG